MRFASADLVLLHNPRCSKSRSARDILTERGLQFTEWRYLEDPPTRSELEQLAERLGSPHTWVRTGEAVYKQLGLHGQSPDATLLDAMAAHPILVERPILVRGQQAVLARPPERVEELL